ncbi:MAG: hypothetical protein OEL66_07260 [Desulfobulbaceae bacterium]|nr:hypothetical protein [Desulfobulbaceae bacterium]
MSDKEMYLCDEVLILRDSGEIPEIAYHTSLYYLTEDPEGPALILDARDLARLREPVLERCRWIILRDLDPGNRQKRIYRGVARSKANWQRFKDFCRRQGLDDEVAPVRREVAVALVVFLERELADAASGISSSINCCRAELEEFASELGIAPTELPTGWGTLCPETFES